MVHLRQRLQFLEGTLCSWHPMTSKGRIFCGKVRCALRFGRVPASVLGSRSKGELKTRKKDLVGQSNIARIFRRLNTEDQAMIEPICGISVELERASGSYTYSGRLTIFVVSAA